MKHLISYKLFESRNYKVLPDEIHSGAVEQLRSIEQFNNVDELFGFYDYWLNVSEPSSEYDPEEVKSRLDSLYSGSPCEGEEWFPMWTSDSDTVEVIMNELSRLYADASFKSGDYRCGNCHRIFRQTNRYQTMCSSSCENEYDDRMIQYQTFRDFIKRI